MSGLLEQLRKFDIYRDVPKELQKKTVGGAVASVMCLLIIAYLVIGEFTAFLSVDTVSEMFVDAPQDTGTQHAEMLVYLNISVPHLPCPLVSVDAQDVMGGHVSDVRGTIHHHRISRSGRYISPYKMMNLAHNVQPDAAEVMKYKLEGCRVSGYIRVKKVPGNFHISAHTHGGEIGLFVDGGVSNFNISHIIHDLWFAEVEDTDGTANAELEKLGDAHDNPLAGTRRIVKSLQHGAPSFEYFVKVVPTQFEPLHRRAVKGFQFVANSNENVGRYRVPALYVRYDLSPITVRFRETSVPLYHFLTQMCAIVGCVFIVMGMVSGLFQRAASIVRKQNEGKLT